MLLLLVVFALWSCSRGDYSGKVETVTIGQTPNETNTLLYLAQERGFFAANGLNVVFKDYGSGVEAANAMLKGAVSLATCAEFVIVGKIFEKENILSIANIDKFENAYIIGRIDKGIRSIADLKGKNIGVARQTSPEFYLGRFLDLHGMGFKEVTLVNVTPVQSVDFLVNGRVGAVAVFQPHAHTIKQKLGDGVVVWPAQSGQLDYFNVISTQAWLASHPGVMNRLLRSLTQAENYLVSHPDETKIFVQKRLQYDRVYINTVWPEHQFSVSLDKGLIAAMEDEARWMIRNNLTNEKTVPDFGNYIYTDGLKAIRPEAVNIIR
jgi:NitT/TauT family transport system substrate-binding protein